MSEIDLSKPVAGKTGKASATKSAPKKAPVNGKPFTISNRLGVQVRDPVTNLHGYATARVDMLSGCVQFAIQPKDKSPSDKVADAQFIDFNLLEEIGDGFSAKLPEVDNTVTVKLGDHVYDSVTKFRGVAVEKYTFQNGCVYFAVQSTRRTHNLFGELPGATRIPHARLKQYRPWYAYFLGLLPKPKPAKVQPPLTVKPIIAPPPAPKAKPPGGPMRSARSMSFRG